MKYLENRPANEIAQVMLMAGEIIDLKLPKVANRLIRKWAFQRDSNDNCVYKREEMFITYKILEDAKHKVLKKQLELSNTSLIKTQMSIVNVLESINQLIPNLK